MVQARGKVGATLVALLAGVAVTPATPAAAVQTDVQKVVAEAPSAATPGVNNGHVEEIAKVGGKIVLGGNFTSATDPGSATALTRRSILAFDAATGKIDTGFAPSFNGQVNALLPGPGDTVYVGGQFSTLDGVSVPKVLLLSTTTGERVSSFAAPKINGRVSDLKLAGGRLYVGGAFSKVAGAAHRGLATLTATTGRLDPFMGIDVAVNHNWTSEAGGAKAPVGVGKLDVDPTGTRLVAIGNFKTVEGTDRDQVFMADISGTSATLADWQTDRYDSRCFASHYDSWVRDVDFSPDGSYFVVVTTGGYPGYDGNLCDSAARWETAATGTALNPTWVNRTGGDTLHSVAVTGPAVYVGGHQRWLNNPFWSDAAGPGAVPRPGIGALDPVNGLPLSWNPGRNPRGVGATALLVTAEGLYVGSDTSYVGLGKTRKVRKRIAFFPLANGTGRAPDAIATLPGTVYQAGRLPSPKPYNVLHRLNEGGPTVRAVDAGPDWTGDEQADASYRTSGSNTAGWGPGADRGSALTADTPTALFDSERWDPAGGPELAFALPVPSGVPLSVRLLFANRCDCTQGSGQRSFDISIEGATVASGYDIVADVGHAVGTVQEFSQTVEDGVLDISFGHVVENPLINGIEVRRTDRPDPPAVAADADDVVQRSYDGRTAGPTSTNESAEPWHHARGGFVVDGTLFYGRADDALLHKRTFDGTTFGPDQRVDPYHGTVWENVSSGSGGTYAGNAPGLYGSLGEVTSMFYAKGRIYYTLSGDPKMYERYFTPESGILGAEQFEVDTDRDWSDTVGAFLDPSGTLYFARGTDQNLYSVSWSDDARVAGQPVAGRPVGPVTLADSSGDWGARAMFLLGS